MNQETSKYSTRWICASCHKLNMLKNIECECGSYRWKRIGLSIHQAFDLLRKISMRAA